MEEFSMGDVTLGTISKLILLMLIAWPTGFALWAKDRLLERRQQNPKAPRICENKAVIARRRLA